MLGRGTLRASLAARATPAEPAGHEGHHVGPCHRGGGDQGTRRRGHHGRDGRGEDEPADADRQHVEGHVGVDVVPGLDGGQDHAGAHADDGAGHPVEDAVDPGRRTAPARDLRRARGEDALPDVLADEQPERVDHEVGDDALRADAGDAEELVPRAFGDTGESARRRQGEGQHEGEDADGLDDELGHVRQGDGPHPADRRVDQDDRPADEDGQCAVPTEEDHEDRGVGARGRGAEHEGVGEHDDARDARGAVPVAQGEHLRDGVDLQPLDGGGEQQAEQQDAGPDGHHEPHAGDAVLVAEAHPAHRGGSAEDDGGHGARVEQGPEAPPRHEVVAGVAGARLAPPAEAQHGDEVGHHDGDIECLHGRVLRSVSLGCPRGNYCCPVSYS